MKNQIIKNISANFLNLLISIFIGLLLTPVLVKKLGMEVYGILPIALFLTFYMGVIAQSLTASVNRFLIEKFISNEIDEANVIFNTAFILIISYVIILVACLFYPIVHIGDFLTVPNGHQPETINLFLCVLFSFMIAMLSSSLSVSMYAKNRIDLMQIGNILRNITKVTSILVFLKLDYISLTYIGFSILFSELIYLVYSIITWRFLTPELLLSRRFFRKSKVKEITSFSGWVLFDQVGTILFLKTDLVLVNTLMGSKENGEYSIATQFSDLLRSMAGLVASSLGPMMVILYEKKQLEQLISMTTAFVKLLSLTIAVPIILLCVFSKEILTLWLGSGFTHLSPLVCLVTLPLIINLGTLPILSINIAVKKIQVPALVNIILALVGLALSFILFKLTGLGYYGIAIAYTLTLTLKNAVFIPWYAASIMNIPKNTFFKTHLNSLLFLLMFYTMIYYIKYLSEKISVNLLVELFSLGVLGMFLTLVFYSKNERNVVFKMIKRK